MNNTFLNRLNARSVLLAVAAIFAALTVWNRVSSGSSKAGDIAEVIPRVIDFGTVFQAGTISNSFSLFNRSDRELRVVAVKPSCSCTVVMKEVLGKTIAPGGHIVIPVAYEVGDRAGPVASTVSVFVAATNALTHLYQVQARLEGSALPEFIIEPAALDFGSLKPGQQESKTVTIRPVNARNLEISEPVSGAPEIRASHSPKRSNVADASSTVVITFQAPTNVTRQETVSEFVSFKTSSERVPTASVYVVGRIVPDVEVTPNIIIVPSSGLSEAGQTELLIRTSEPSRIRQLTRKGLDALIRIQSPDQPSTVEAWNKAHHLKIPNALLAQAVGVNVELEVHGEADRIGARSVFVPIKSLNSNKQP